MSKAPLSSRDVLEKNANRKTQSEKITRRLVSSSYPHSLHANIVYALMRSKPDVNLDELAVDLRAQERELPLLTFVRSINIELRDGKLKVTTRRADGVASRNLEAVNNNLVTLWVYKFKSMGYIPDTSAALVAEMFIQNYFTSISKSKSPLPTRDWSVKRYSSDESTANSLGDVRHLLIRTLTSESFSLTLSSKGITSNSTEVYSVTHTKEQDDDVRKDTA